MNEFSTLCYRVEIKEGSDEATWIDFHTKALKGIPPIRKSFTLWDGKIPVSNLALSFADEGEILGSWNEKALENKEIRLMCDYQNALFIHDGFSTLWKTAKDFDSIEGSSKLETSTQCFQMKIFEDDLYVANWNYILKYDKISLEFKEKLLDGEGFSEIQGIAIDRSYFYFSAKKGSLYGIFKYSHDKELCGSNVSTTAYAGNDLWVNSQGTLFYCQTWPSKEIRLFDTLTLSNIGSIEESVSPFGITGDENFLYCLLDEGTIKKRKQSDLSLVQSTVYSDCEEGIDCDPEFLYIGFPSGHTYYVVDKEDLSLVATHYTYPSLHIMRGLCCDNLQNEIIYQGNIRQLKFQNGITQIQLADKGRNLSLSPIRYDFACLSEGQGKSGNRVKFTFKNKVFLKPANRIIFPHFYFYAKGADTLKGWQMLNWTETDIVPSRFKYPQETERYFYSVIRPLWENLFKGTFDALFQGDIVKFASVYFEGTSGGSSLDPFPIYKIEGGTFVKENLAATLFLKDFPDEVKEDDFLYMRKGIELSGKPAEIIKKFFMGSNFYLPLTEDDFDRYSFEMATKSQTFQVRNTFMGENVSDLLNRICQEGRISFFINEKNQISFFAIRPFRELSFSFNATNLESISRSRNLNNILTKEELSFKTKKFKNVIVKGSAATAFNDFQSSRKTKAEWIKDFAEGETWVEREILENSFLTNELEITTATKLRIKLGELGVVEYPKASLSGTYVVLGYHKDFEKGVFSYSLMDFQFYTEKGIGYFEEGSWNGTELVERDVSSTSLSGWAIATSSSDLLLINLNAKSANLFDNQITATSFGATGTVDWVQKDDFIYASKAGDSYQFPEILRVERVKSTTVGEAVLYVDRGVVGTVSALSSMASLYKITWDQSAATCFNFEFGSITRFF